MQDNARSARNYQEAYTPIELLQRAIFILKCAACQDDEIYRREAIDRARVYLDAAGHKQ